MPAVAAEAEKVDLWELGKAPDGERSFTEEKPFLLLHRPEQPNGAVSQTYCRVEHHCFLSLFFTPLTNK